MPQNQPIPFQSPTTAKIQPVPPENWNDALQQGYKPTQHTVMYSPDGQRGMVPNEQAADYAKQGYKSFANLTDSDTQQFISRMGQPKWLVQAPDGKTIQFPDNFTDADVTREMSKLYGAPKAAPNPYLETAEDVATGINKGMLNTVTGVSSLLNKLPWVGKYLAPSEGITAMKQMSQPT